MATRSEGCTSAALSDVTPEHPGIFPAVDGVCVVAFRCGSSWLEAIFEVSKLNRLVAAWAGTHKAGRDCQWHYFQLREFDTNIFSRRSRGALPVHATLPSSARSFPFHRCKLLHLLLASRDKVILPGHSKFIVTTKLCSCSHSLCDRSLYTTLS